MTLPIPTRAVVIGQESRLTKENKLFWQMTLRTVIGNVKAFMWSVPNDVETNPNYPHAGDIIQLDDFKDQLKDRQNIVVNTFHRITKESVPPEDQAIFHVDKASEADMQWAYGLLKDSSFWKDAQHHKFVMACLSKLDLEKLKTCPAAVMVHHTYSGGLLIHTAEVLALAKAYVESSPPRYGFVNCDVLYAAAILHDIGKMETYDWNEFGTTHQLLNEKIITHIFYAMNLVQVVASEGKVKVQSEFVNELLHCIAAHHGSREWGALVEPQSLEAGIISRLDYISSRNGMMEKVLKETVLVGQPLQNEFRIYGDQYFASLGIRKYVEEQSSELAIKFR